VSSVSCSTHSAGEPWRNLLPVRLNSPPMLKMRRGFGRRRRNRLIMVALPVVVGWRRELRVVLAQVVQVLRGCLRGDIEETTHAW
jgi:hypothetical protein